MLDTIADFFSMDPLEDQEEDDKRSYEDTSGPIVDEIGFTTKKVNRKAAQCLNPQIFMLKWFSCSQILDDKRNYPPKFWRTA